MQKSDKKITLSIRDNIDKILNYSWINEDPEKVLTFIREHERLNPLVGDEADNFTMRIMKLLVNPDYFYFTCKHIFNIDIPPIQNVILKELWNRPFPMLIGSRGFGKCITKDSLILTNNGYCTIGSLFNENSLELEKLPVSDLHVYGENGFYPVEYIWKNPEEEVISLATRYRYHLDGTFNHPIRVVTKTGIQWKNLSEIFINNYIPICRDVVILPNNSRITPNEAYMFGLLVGDGGYTVRGRISFTTADIELLEKLNECSKCVFGKEFKRNIHSKYGYNLYDVDIWDSLFTKYGFNSSVCEEKNVPVSVLNGGTESIRYFLRGLFDTNGSVSKNHAGVGVCSKSAQLVETTQSLLLNFGIISRVRKKLNKKYNRYYYHLEISGDAAKLFHDRIGFGLTRKQDKLKSKLDIKHNTNIDIIPHELILDDILRLRLKCIEAGITLPSSLSAHSFKMYQCSYEKLRKFLSISQSLYKEPEYQKLLDILNKNYFYDKVTSLNLTKSITYDLYIPEDHSFISNGIISHNSFLLGLYTMLLLLLKPDTTVIIAGAGFRQSKVIFEYMENIWYNAPILRDICGQGKQGPFHDADRWTMRIGDNKAIAIPVGDGCITGSSMTTYSDCFGYISDDSPNFEGVQCRDRYVWGNNEFRLTDESYNNNIKPTKKIVTKKGYSIEGTYNHKIKILRDNNIQFIRFDQIKVGDYTLIDRSQRWHSGGEIVDSDQAYAIGLMIGGGCWGLESCYAQNKTLPAKILSASQESMTACVQGLYDTDGHVSVSETNGGVSCSVNFTNTSERLIDQLQYILLHYGIISSKRYRDRNEKRNRTYELIISGPNVKIFAKKIGFRLTRKQSLLVNAISRQVRNFATDDIIPRGLELVSKILQEYNIHANSIPRIRGLKRLSRIRANDIIIAFDKLGLKCDELETLRQLSNPNIFLDTIKEITHSIANTYDIHVPDGHEYCANGFFSHNSRIRGLRATNIIADEFAVLPPAIFEHVISGFASVTSTPIENIRRSSRLAMLKNMGLADSNSSSTIRVNQSIFSGTAFYDFNHFAQYWRKHKAIINSQGDERVLKDIMGGVIEPGFNWRDYSIIRIPYDIIPEGFMDAKNIARARATVHTGIFQMEYGAVFCTDTNGFFKASLINACTTNDPINVKGEMVQFKPMLSGDRNKNYVFGIDPAAEIDNFSIVVIELGDGFRKVVYCWTTSKKKHQTEVFERITSEHDFYAYCGRKIRMLMKAFPCVGIAIDSQGGGGMVAEVLQNKRLMEEGEMPLWPAINPSKDQPTDNYAGKHILHMINFADAKWTSAANHGMRKDFEEKLLLFPYFDAFSIGLAIEEDKRRASIFDSLEDCVQEIEELKRELYTIVVTLTDSTNRERWDTPDIKDGSMKKGRLRKDRYSALLMANAIARDIQIESPEIAYNPEGGFANQIELKPLDQAKTFGDFYSAPDWYINEMKDGGLDFPGMSVGR